MIDAETFLNQYGVVSSDAEDGFDCGDDCSQGGRRQGNDRGESHRHKTAEVSVPRNREDSNQCDRRMTGDRESVLDECRDAALRLLDAAPRSSGALRERLLGKGYDEDIVDDVIMRLIQVSLLDDRAYAESAVRYCIGRMMGRRGAIAQLVRKGVERTLAEEVTGEAEAEGAFEESAWQLGRSVARKTNGLDRRVRQRRFWSAGGRRGHNPETLRRIAAELF